MKIANVQRSFQGLIVAIVTVIVGATATFTPPPAHAQWAVECVNCSDMFTQLTQYAEEAETAVNTAQSYAQEIQMYNNMVQQGLALPGQVWGSIQSDLNGLTNLVNQGSNISYATSGIATQFSKQFPSYQQFLSSPQTATQTQTDLQNWTQESLDAANTTLQADGLQSQQMTSENAVMATLQQHSMSAAGQMQAIQAGNEMAGQVVDQLQKLRQLVMAQSDMQAQALAAQARQVAADKAAWQQQHIAPTSVTIDSTTQTPGPGGMSPDSGN